MFSSTTTLKTVIMFCDGSQNDVGAAPVHQLPLGEETLIIIASRAVSEVENNYSQLEKDALAIMFGVKGVCR